MYFICPKEKIEKIEIKKIQKKQKKNLLASWPNNTRPIFGLKEF
jgi:hypothetical protein